MSKMRKIGSNLHIKGIVIHQVLKQAGERRAIAKNASHPLVVEEKEQTFIGNLHRTYFDKSNPVYGIFGNEDLRFKGFLAKYLTKKDFFTFSLDALSLYKQKLEATISATGGFLIFAHYSNSDTDSEYMLTLTINNKDGYMVSESDLTLKNIKNLDLSKVDVACLVNMTKWEDVESGADTESKTYLSFVRGNKEVSYYFMSFIDCDNKTTSAESTNRLIRALEDFCKERDYDRETMIRKRNEIFQYCDDRLTSKNEIQLSAISALLDAESPDDFRGFASKEEYGVSPIINGDKAKLKRIKFVSYRDKEMAVEFNTNLLTKGDVVYDAKKNVLTFKKVPEGLASQIQKLYAPNAG